MIVGNMLHKTTSLIYDFAHDKYGIYLNDWQIKSIEYLMNTESHHVVLTPDRQVGKTTLINLLADAYSFLRKEKVCVIYPNTQMLKYAESNITYYNSNNVYRTVIGISTKILITGNYDLLLIDEWSGRQDIIDINVNKSIMMYTP